MSRTPSRARRSAAPAPALSPPECERLVEAILSVGAEMVRAGAEARRAEDTMRRISEAYRFAVLDSFAVTSQVELSVRSPDGRHYTQAMRIERVANDLGRVEELNAAARRICADVPPVSRLPDYLPPTEEGRPFRWGEFLGYPLSSFAFALFFGGGVLDGAASALVSLGVYLTDRYVRLRRQNYFIYTLLACFLAGCFAQVLVGAGRACGWGSLLHTDKVMIGDIMLFIPGLSIVNGIKEMFYRDIMTGILRILEALLVTVAIAVGYALSILLCGALSRGLGL